MLFSLVIPTYNERPNITPFVGDLVCDPPTSGPLTARAGSDVGLFSAQALSD